MLLNIIMQTQELLATPFLQRGSVDYQLNGSVLNEARSVVVGLEAECDNPSIAFLADPSLMVCCRQMVFSAVYSYSELIPEPLPVGDVSIECVYIEFWEFNSCAISGSRSGCVHRGNYKQRRNLVRGGRQLPFESGMCDKQFVVLRYDFSDKLSGNVLPVI